MRNLMLYLLLVNHLVLHSSLLTHPLLPIHQVPRLLLHIAIDNSDIEMVTYLLSRGANVSGCGHHYSYYCLLF